MTKRPRPKPLAYVAGPFRGDETRNIARANQCANALRDAGFYAFVPHNSVVSQFVEPDIADDFWLEEDLAILERCDLIVMVEGWENSLGSRGEHDLAGELDIPRFALVLDKLAEGSAAIMAVWKEAHT